MSKPDWRPIETMPEGREYLTRILDAEHGERNVQTLRRQGRLFFLPSGGMYVYYQPTHWAEEPKP